MSHVFLVHPETGDVSSLKDALRDRGPSKSWELSHFESARAALDGLGKADCEVIILSGRLSDHGLEEIVTTLKRDYPRVARIVAAEDKLQEFTLRGAVTAHQFLSHPYSTSDLANAVDRALSLRDFTRSKNVLKVVSSIKRLPALPENYQKVSELLKQDDVSLQDLIDVIGKDMAMVSKILQIANSAQFASRRKPVNTVQSGVKLLGLSNLKLLVLAVEVFSQLEEKTSQALDPHALWNHSMQVSALAGKISETLKKDKDFCNEAMSAGMLHDVGKLVLLNHFPEELTRTVALAEKNQISFATAELEIFGTSHAEIGGYLLGSWGLPHPIVEAVAYHHSPQSCFSKAICPLTPVVFANIIEKASSERRTPELDAAAQGYLTQLGLEAEFSNWTQIP